MALAHSTKKEDGWGAVRIWDQSGNRVHEITEPTRDALRGSVIFSGDRKSLIRSYAADKGDQIEAYVTRTWIKFCGVRTYPFVPESISLSPDGKWLALGGGARDASATTSAIAILHVTSHQVVRWIPAFSADQTVSVMDWSADSQRIVAGTANSANESRSILALFDADSGKTHSDENASADAVNTVQFTHDGKYLIVAREKKSIVVWDSQHKKVQQEIPIQYARTAVSNNSQYIGVTSLGQVSIWQFK